MDLDRILKPEEIIDRLKYSEKQCVRGYYYILIRPDVRNRIIELLKKKKAVEPVITPWLTDDDGNVIVARKECGKCGYQFFTEEPNYCESCGTPILWEGR